jgi:hypothetical protein
MTPRKKLAREEVRIFCRNMNRISKAVKDHQSPNMFYCWACGRILGRDSVEDTNHRREAIEAKS